MSSYCVMIRAKEKACRNATEIVLKEAQQQATIQIGR